MLSLVIALLVVVSLAWLAHHVVRKFKEADGSFWDRVLAGFKDSATVLVAGATYVGGALVTVIVKTAEAFNAPEVAATIQSLPTEYVSYGTMVLAVAVFIARLRTL